MKIKLVIDENIDFNDLPEKIANGARFIVFSYCIGLGLVALKRMSPAIFIENENQLAHHKKRYNLVNYILGWWAVPYGLIYTPSLISTNNKGGIDVTEDVMLNLTETSLKEKMVTMSHTKMLFDFPEKSDEKIFRKLFAKAMQKDADIYRIAAGWRLDEKPYYVIGIDAKNNSDYYVESLHRVLRKDFYKNVMFTFIDISEHNNDLLKDELLIECLLKQGLVVSRSGD